MKKFKIENIINIIIIILALIIDYTDVVGSGIISISLIFILIIFHFFWGWHYYRNEENDVAKYTISVPFSLILVLLEFAIMFKIMSWNFNNILLIIALLVMMGFGGFIFYKNKINKSYYFKNIIKKIIFMFILGVAVLLLNLKM